MTEALTEADKQRIRKIVVEALIRAMDDRTGLQFELPQRRDIESQPVSIHDSGARVVLRPTGRRSLTLDLAWMEP